MCVPSQNGLFLELPHLQRAKCLLVAAFLPVQSMRAQLPSTSKGPFFMTLICAEVISDPPSFLAILYERAPEGHLSMTFIISSESAPLISTHGRLSRLNTCGRPLMHSPAWMHLCGFQQTTISSLLYSFIKIRRAFFLLRVYAIFGNAIL